MLAKSLRPWLDAAWRCSTARLGCVKANLSTVAHDEQGAYASVTVMLEGGIEAGGTGPSQSMTAAVKMAVDTISSGLEAELRSVVTPTFVVAYTNAPKPVSQSLMEAIAAATAKKWSKPIPLVGCSSVQWRTEAGVRLNQLMDLAAAADALMSGREVAPGLTTEGAQKADEPPKETTSGVARLAPKYHLTLAVAHLPKLVAYSFHSPTGSLPQLPHLSESFTTRPPQFLLFCSSETMMGEMRGRLQNLFGERSTLAGAVALRQPTAQRVAMALVGVPGLEPVSMLLNGERSEGTQISSDQIRSAGETSDSTPSPMAKTGARGQRSKAPIPANHVQASVFMGSRVLDSGCSGLALFPDPDSASDLLRPKSAVTLSRMLFGCDQYESVAMHKFVVAELEPPPTTQIFKIPTVKPPSSKDALTWLPATIQLPGRPASKSDSQSDPDSCACEPSVPALSDTSQSAWSAPATNELGEVVKLTNLPLFSLGSQFILFPGERMQLRISEKRYKLMIKAAVQQGKCFGFPSNGMGVTAIVRRYLLDGSDFYVEVEGGSRMVYEAPQCRVLPATFGLNVADAVLIHDLMPSNEEAAVELVEVSRSILHLLHKGAVLAAPDPRRESSRKFANAMFMASASRDPSGGEGEGGASAAEASQSEGFKLEAADLDKVCNKLDVKAAQSLSILLSPFLPVDFDLRRRWFRSLDSVSRSKEQLQQMSDHPNLGMATAAAILKADAGHPIRTIVGF